MSSSRTAWHVAFAALLMERAPPGIEIRPEVALSKEPQRVDLLLLRREKTTEQDGQAQVLRKLWSRIVKDCLLEFKSVTHPFRQGDLIRLLGYGAQYHATQIKRIDRVRDLILTLVVADITPTLREELAFLRARMHRQRDGYTRIRGLIYPMYVLSLDSIAQAERDDLLSSFGHSNLWSREARQWWRRMVATPMKDTPIEELDGFDEIEEKFAASLPLEKRLNGLTPEQIHQLLEEHLAHLAPEQRLAGLAPEQRLAGLAPEQRLVGLTPEQLDSLVKALLQQQQRR